MAALFSKKEGENNMGNVHMEARQVNYRGGENPMSVEEAIKKAGSSYVLPFASAETLGGIKVGDNLTINSETGVLSASDGSSIDYSTTEREVGEYFGKTLYEKSYLLIDNGVAQYTVSNNEYEIGMTGYDDVFIEEVIGVRSGAGDVYVDSITSGAEVTVVFNKTDGSIYFASSHTYTTFIAVVRYTKTPTP